MSENRGCCCSILIVFLVILLMFNATCTALFSDDDEPDPQSYTRVRQRLVAVAQQEYDEHGKTPGVGSRYWGYWGKKYPEDWCVNFVYFCADQCGMVGEGLPFGPYTANCTVAWKQVEAAGATVIKDHSDVQAGDLIFWWNTKYADEAAVHGKVEYLSHIGIVASVDEDGTIHTIEGNTNSGGMGCTKSQVAAHEYGGYENNIAGFLRINCGTALSGSLTDYIIGFEGFSKFPQWDYGQWSVGYGTRCPADRLSRYRQYGIPENEARELLEEFILNFADAVDEWIDREGLRLEDFERDALISLSYNIGTGWLSGGYDDLKRIIKRGGSDTQLMNTMAQICHAGGKILPALVQRRICEAHLYLTGEYTNDYRQTGWTYKIIGDSVVVTKGG